MATAPSGGPRFGRLAPATLGLALGLTLGVAGLAQAQTASQITPPSFAPPLQGGGGGLAIPDGAGPQAPPGATRLSVRARAVRIDGDLRPRRRKRAPSWRGRRAAP